MADNMQIMILEQGLYDLEEEVKRFIKEQEDILLQYEVKMKMYETFLQNFEGGVKLPQFIQENLKKHIKEIIEDDGKEKEEEAVEEEPKKEEDQSDKKEEPKPKRKLKRRSKDK